MADREKIHDFSKYDSLSTEELESILRLDLLFSEDEEPLEEDALLYIAGVLAERKGEEPAGKYKSVEEAWAAFAEEESGRVVSMEEQRAKRRGRRGLARMAGVAAAMVAAVCALTLTAYAFGYDLFGSMAEWTGSVFRFEKVGEALDSEDAVAQKVIPDELEDFAAMLDKYIPSSRYLPTYIPEGYTVKRESCTDMNTWSSISCALEKEGKEEYLWISYIVHYDGEFGREFQKDAGDPEVYVAGGVAHYIFTNTGTYVCAWAVDNVECSVTGIDSREDAVKIINSIYGGN